MIQSTQRFLETTAEMDPQAIAEDMRNLSGKDLSTQLVILPEKLRGHFALTMHKDTLLKYR